MTSSSLVPVASRSGAVALLGAATAIAVAVALIVGVDSEAVGGGALAVARVAGALAAAVMIGPLVFALFALPRGVTPFALALETAAVGAAAFTVAAAAGAVLTFWADAPPGLGDDGSPGEHLVRFLFELPSGRAWSLTVALGVAVTVLAVVGRSWIAVLITAILALTALVPLSAQRGGAVDLAVTSLFLQSAAAAMWLGAGALLVLLRGCGAAAESAWVRRFSALSTLALVVLAAATLTGWAASPDAGDEGVPLAQGAILAALALTVVLTLPRDRHPPSRVPVAAALGVQLVLLAAVTGLTAGRTGSSPRPPAAGQSPAEQLTGAALPPELTPERWIVAVRPDDLWLLVSALALVAYTAGVVRLHRRGQSWPVSRILAALLALVLVLWVTNGAVNVYREVLISVHLLGQGLLAIVIPLLVVLAAPITLARAAAQERTDGSRGIREWIVAAETSPLGRTLSHPLVAAALLLGSLAALSLTGMLRWVVSDHVGHEWMVAHLLVVGTVFTAAVLTAPAGRGFSVAGRLSTVAVVLAGQLLVVFALTRSGGLLVAEWFGAMGRSWGATPLQDQVLGALVAGGVAVAAALMLAVAVLVTARARARNVPARGEGSDVRALPESSVTVDPAESAELAEYNAQLRALAARRADRRADRAR